MHLLGRLRAFVWRPNRDGTVVQSFLAGILIFVFLAAGAKRVLVPAKPSPCSLIFRTRRASEPTTAGLHVRSGRRYFLPGRSGAGRARPGIECRIPRRRQPVLQFTPVSGRKRVGHLDAPENGIYRFVLESHEYSGAIAQPIVKVSVLSPQTGKERDRLAGLRLLSEASAAGHLSSVEGRTRALQAYERAALLFRNTGDDLYLARSLFSAATLNTGTSHSGTVLRNWLRGRRALPAQRQ